MRGCGVDYAYLFKAFALVPLRDETEYAEAQGRIEWLNSRTELSQSALDYKSVLELIITQYEVAQLDLPEDDDPADEDAPPKPKRGRKKKGATV